MEIQFHLLLAYRNRFEFLPLYSKPLDFRSLRDHSNRRYADNVNICETTQKVDKIVIHKSIYYEYFVMDSLIGDCSFIPGHSDLNNHTETLLTTRLLG